MGYTVTMDSIVASAVIGGLSRSRRERFDEYDDDEYSDMIPSLAPGFFKPRLDGFSTILGVLIAATAAYLSWTCNTALGYSKIEKVVWAFGAGVFGTLYLIYFALFRHDYCRAAMRASGGK